MSRKAILGMGCLGIALATIGYLIWPFSRTRDRESASFVRINERKVGGHVESFSEWAPLASYQTGPGEYVEWVVSTTENPSKPQFAINIRRGPPDRTSWEAEVKQPVTLFVDGRRLELKPRREVVSPDRRAWAYLVCDGNRSDLAALAEAKSAEIEIGGRRYDLGDQGLANCRELMKRTAAVRGNGR